MKKPHILHEVDAEVGVAEQVGEEQLICNTVAHPYIVAGKKGMAFGRRWYGDVTEVTRSAAIVGINVEECVEKRKKQGNTTVGARARVSHATLVSRAAMRKCVAKTEERELKLGIF